MKLKYLFETEFKDGTIYKQNKLDASIKFPPIKDANGQLQGKNCMADIQEDVDNFNIKRFTLIEQGFLGKKYTVDLTDGHFEIDGTTIEAEADRALPIKNARFKLIYFLISTVQHTSPALFNNPKSVTNTQEGGIEVVNRIGQKHLFPKVAKVWSVDEKDSLDGVMQNVHKVYILPEVPVPPRRYMIGWQTTISGKNYQQKIIIQ